MSDAASYAESLYSELELGWAPLYAWRTAASKFSKAPHPELYDLDTDPSETRNRVGEQHARAAGTIPHDFACGINTSPLRARRVVIDA